MSDTFQEVENECTGDQDCKHSCPVSNLFIVNAVRLAYYTGDFKGAIDVIAEAVGENLLAASSRKS